MSEPIAAPQAPDLDAVFDIEGGMEGPIAVVLLAAGIVDPETARRDADTNLPRVEVQVQLGQCILRNKFPAGATDPRQALPSAWNVTLVFSVVTDRTVAVQREAHGKMRGKVRRLGAQFFTSLNTRLPFHFLQKMEEAGTRANLVNDEARTEDISQISFTGQVSVRGTAWPAGS